MRRVCALLLSSIAVVACGLTAPAAWAGGPDAVVRAWAPDDGQTVKRSGLVVGFTGSDTIDSTNLAEAYAHDCTGCEAVATSFQAVVATGRPSTVAPQNLAVAVTSNCTGCKVFAYAYQYVVTAERPFRITERDVREVRAIKREAAALTRSGLEYPELDARLQALAQRFREAIDTALARVKVQGRGEEHEDVQERGWE